MSGGGAGKGWENLKRIWSLVPELETFFWPDDGDMEPDIKVEVRMRNTSHGKREAGMEIGNGIETIPDRGCGADTPADIGD